MAAELRIGSPEGTSDMTYTCFNELFVTAHVDDILNTDSVTVIYNIHKYIFNKVHRTLKLSAHVAYWHRACFARKRPRVLIPSVTLFIFILFYYFTWNANRQSCRAGMPASAELLVQQ